MGSLVSSVSPFTFPFLHCFETNSRHHILLKKFEYISLKEKSFIFYTPNIKFLISDIQLVLKCSIVYSSFCFYRFYLNPDINVIYTSWFIEVSFNPYIFLPSFFPHYFIHWRNGIVYPIEQVLAKFFLKYQVEYILVMMGHMVCVTDIQLYCCTVKAATDSR